MNLKTISAYAVARGLPAVANVAFMLFGAYALSPAEFGRFSLAMSGTTAINAVLFHWNRLALVRFFGGDPRQQDEQRAYAAVSYYFLIATVLGLASLVVSMWAPDRTSLMSGTALVLIGRTSFDYTLDLRRARLDDGGYLRQALVRTALVVLAMLLLVNRELTAGGLLTVWGATLTLSSAPALLLEGYGAIRMRSRLTWDAFRKLLFFGGPVSLGYATEMLVSYSDRYFLAGLHGLTSVGAYVFAYDLFKQGVSLALLAIYLPFSARLGRLIERKEAAAVLSMTQRYWSLQLLVGLSAAAVATLAWGTLVSIASYDKYDVLSAWQVAGIAACALMFAWKVNMADLWWQLNNRTGTILRTAIVAAALNLAANYLLIELFGVSGAIAATVLTYLWVGTAFVATSGAEFRSLVASRPSRSLFFGGALALGLAGLALAYRQPWFGVASGAALIGTWVSSSARRALNFEAEMVSGRT